LSCRRLQRLWVRRRGGGVDGVQYRRHVDDTGDFRVEAAVVAEPGRPGHCSAATPGIRWRSQLFAGSAAIAEGFEVVKRAVDIAQLGAAAAAEELRADHGVAAGRRMPGTGEVDHGTAGKLD